MSKLIGTAGHVDHGKTSLIRALTGIDADRLPEEKARGLTIDIGFAYLDLPEVGRVSIVDVPGHERFVSNMLVGATGIDVALLCVAADEGVKPQTVEHFQILDLLRVQHMVVALTRSDLADQEMRQLVGLQIDELLGSSRFKDARRIAVSAKSGQGIEELRDELQRLLIMEIERESGKWYLPIDRVFSVKGHGTVVTGTLARGEVKSDSNAVLEPGGFPVRIRSIQSHESTLETAQPGQRTAVNVSGIKLPDIKRGMVLAEPGAVFETSLLEAEVRWISPAKHAESVRVAIGSADFLGMVYLRAEKPELIQVRLREPAAVALNQPIIVRRHSPPDLLGGGRITVPQAKGRRQPKPEASGTTLADSVLDTIRGESFGIETAELCRRLGRTAQELGDVIEDLRHRGEVRGFAGLWLSETVWQTAKDSMLNALQQLHKMHPTSPWQPRETMTKAAGIPWNGKPLDRAISAMVAAGELQQQGTLVRHPDFQIRLTDRQSQFLERVIVELEKSNAATPGVHDLAKALAVPMPAVEEVVKLGQMAGRLVSLEGGVIYTASQLESLKMKLKEMAQEEPFTAAQARDHLGVSRKYAIPLLEHFDKIGFTLRIGDSRVIR
ncbi:MAG TPA: selenocysteine-specific translation elongation factor [Fimbriimonadaceae bacterium]|nr:selenocysteine-specific translation elongation factor [Fimbriimonadaceae bacterium]